MSSGISRQVGVLSSPAVAEREPIAHAVKSWPHLFATALTGERTHELRRSTDRDYRVGDTLVLCEFDPASQTYTGREHEVVITYITSAANPCALSDSGLASGFCILSIAPTKPNYEIRRRVAIPRPKPRNSRKKIRKT